MKYLVKIHKIISSILISCIRGFRPFLGPACCKYQFSCTDYACFILKEKPLTVALWLIVKRICSCIPFYRKKL